jgi:hypothetical protein
MRFPPNDPASRDHWLIFWLAFPAKPTGEDFVECTRAGKNHVILPQHKALQCGAVDSGSYKSLRNGVFDHYAQDPSERTESNRALESTWLHLTQIN